MPADHEIDDTGLVRTRCHGAVAFDEVLDHFAELADDPALPPRLDVLLDLSDATSAPASDQVRSIAGVIERLQSRVEWGTCAVVAHRDVLFGMARVFEVFTGDSFDATMVFRELDEGEKWLEATREG